MYCRSCNKNYPDGQDLCLDCGHALEAPPKVVWGMTPPENVIGDWPLDIYGGPVNPAFLTHCNGADMDDVLFVNMLDAYDFPCMVNYPNNGQFGKLILGISGSGVDVYVPETIIDEVRAFLREVENEQDEL